MTAATMAVRTRSVDIAGWARRNGWVLGLVVFLAGLFAVTKFIQPTYGVYAVQGLGISAVPLALAAVAQAVVVIGGGIDLSIGSMMALTSCVAATAMVGHGEDYAVGVVVVVLVLGVVLGAINGGLVVTTGVPDIIVTLAMSFVWAGFALIVRAAPGGTSAQWLMNLMVGSFGSEWLPKAIAVLLILVFGIWIPVQRSRLGLSIYAIGSNQLAAFRSGISVGRTKVLAYALTGLFSAIAGLSLLGGTGIGTPVPGPYTLESVAAVVLGGVSLAGGQGGVLGPIVAVVILQLIATDMTFLNMDSNLALVAQGVILIGVVMFGSLVQLRRSRS